MDRILQGIQIITNSKLDFKTILASGLILMILVFGNYYFKWKMRDNPKEIKADGTKKYR